MTMPPASLTGRGEVDWALYPQNARWLHRCGLADFHL
jgi:hypothetical protein